MHKSYKFSLILILLLAFACSNEGDYKKDLSLDVDIQETESEILISINIENNSDYEYYFPETGFIFTGYYNRSDIGGNMANQNIDPKHVNSINYYPIQNPNAEYNIISGNLFGKKLLKIYEIKAQDKLNLSFKILKNVAVKYLFRGNEYVFLINTVIFSEEDISKFKELIPNFQKTITTSNIIKYNGEYEEYISIVETENSHSTIKIDQSLIKKADEIANKYIQAKQIFTANE